MTAFRFEADQLGLSLFDGQQRVFQLDRARKQLINVAFKPGGEPLIGGRGGGSIALYWQRPNWSALKPDEIAWKTAVRDGGRSARLDVRSRDKGGVLEHRTTVDVSWSRRRGSYLLDFDTSVRVMPGKSWQTFECGWYDGMEYLDFSPTGVFDMGWNRPEPWPNTNPPQNQPWGAPERYKTILFTDEHGHWRKYPLNHLVARWCNRNTLGGQGLFLFAAEKVGNPVVQLKGDTLRRTQVSLCHWMYDVHFVLPSATHVEGPATAKAQFALFAVGADQARKWDRQARPLAVSAWDRYRYALPVYAPPGEVSTMSQIIQPDKYDPRRMWNPFCGESGFVGREIPIDFPNAKFSWTPDGGRDGKGAAMVHSDQAGTRGWVSDQHPTQLLPNTRYRLSAWVRTRDLKGPGATLGIDATMPIGGKMYPSHEKMLVCPKAVKGTRGWTKIDWLLPPFGDNSGIDKAGLFYRFNVVRVYLLQQGTGTTWFDDVLLTPLAGKGKR